MNTAAISTERLERWKQRLRQHNATPVLLIGVGHEHQSGKLIVCTCEEISNDDMMRLIGYAIEQLAEGS